MNISKNVKNQFFLDTDIVKTIVMKKVMTLTTCEFWFSQRTYFRMNRPWVLVTITLDASVTCIQDLFICWIQHDHEQKSSPWAYNKSDEHPRRKSHTFNTTDMWCACSGYVHVNRNMLARHGLLDVHYLEIYVNYWGCSLADLTGVTWNIAD